MLEGCVEVSLRRQLIDQPSEGAEVALFDVRVSVRREDAGFVWDLTDEETHGEDHGEPESDEASACRHAARAFAQAIERRA